MNQIAPLALALVVDVVALRTLRLAAAMTQRDLARKAGVARVTVSRLESGQHASAYSVRRIADALDVTPDTFTRVVPS